MRCTVEGLMPVRPAMRRTLQWVVPSGGGPRVSATRRSRSSRVYVGGCPGRGASARPAKPAAAYRRRHSLTVMIATPSSAAIRSIGAPSAERSTIRARVTARCSLVRARTAARSAAWSESSTIKAGAGGWAMSRIVANIHLSARHQRHETLGADDPSMQLLMTVPGVGWVLAYTIASKDRRHHPLRDAQEAGRAVSYTHLTLPTKRIV